jgi:AcrR family transcriptional regulator
MPRVVDIEQRRTELTDATARVIARSGIEAATMREIAAEAGWTTGALTHYFTDKRDLLLATFQASLAARRSLRAGRAHASLLDQLRASLEGALPLDDDRRRHWLVTLACCTQASGDEQLAAAQRDAYREFRDHVADLVRESRIADQQDARSVAERLIAIVDGVAVQALFDPGSWPPDRQLATLAATQTGPPAGLWRR